MTGGPAARPRLDGRVVVVTRAADGSGALRRRLERVGAEVCEMPLIAVEPLPAPPPDLTAYGWIVLTSANGARFLSGLDPDRWPPPPRVRIAAVGPATASAAASTGARVDLIPERAVAEALLDAFPDPGVPGERVLIARAETGRDVLPEGLRARGYDVDVLAVYRTVAVAPPPALVERIRAGGVDAVTFTSPSTVSHLVTAVPDAAGLLAGTPGAARVVTIGPVTSDRARALGLTVAAEAAPHTVDGLVGALLALFAAPSRTG